MQNAKIDELEREIIWCRNEIEVRAAMIKNQDEKINELREHILELQDDKKALLGIVKGEIKPIIHEKSNRKDNSK